MAAKRTFLGKGDGGSRVLPTKTAAWRALFTPLVRPGRFGENDALRFSGIRLFSATQIGWALGVPVLAFDLPRTFAEIEAPLVN